MYVTGNFYDTTDFDPGPDSFNLTSVTDQDNETTADIFVAKYDSEGQFLWAVSFGGSNSDRGLSIATDSFNNVYITGLFSGNLDFDPGPDEYYLSGLFDGFILKLDANGSFVWAGKLDIYLTSEFTVDQAGNLYLTGRFGGTRDFDPGPGVHNVTANGNIDLFILKLDSDGNFLWLKNMGSDLYARGNSVALDGLGNIYVLGEFNESVDFDSEIPLI